MLYIPEMEYLSPEDKAKVSPIPCGLFKYALWLIVFTTRNAMDIGALIGVFIIVAIAVGSIWGNTASIVTAISLLLTLVVVEVIARLVHSNAINPDLRDRILDFQEKYERMRDHGHSILLHKCVSKNRVVSYGELNYDIFEGAYSTEKVPECRCHTAYLRLHLRQCDISRRLVHLEHETASSMSIIERGHNVKYEQDPRDGTRMRVFVDLGPENNQPRYENITNLLSFEFMAYELTREWFARRSTVITTSHNHLEAKKRELADAQKNALELATFWIDRYKEAIGRMADTEEEMRKTTVDRPSRAIRDLRMSALEAEQHLILTIVAHSPIPIAGQTRTDVELFMEHIDPVDKSHKGRLREISSDLDEIKRLNDLDKEALEDPKK